MIEGADEIAVALGDGRIAKAKVVGTDAETDLAVLRISADRLRPISFGASEALQVGDAVLAIGNPFGVGQTVTQGIVSASSRQALKSNLGEIYQAGVLDIYPGGVYDERVNRRFERADSGLCVHSPSASIYGVTTGVCARLVRARTS